MSKVGFIGVGTMGCPMASNIISKGNDLKVFCKSKEFLNVIIPLAEKKEFKLISFLAN